MRWKTMKKQIFLAALLVQVSLFAGAADLLGLSQTLHKKRNILAGYIASTISEIPYWFPGTFNSVNENLLFKLSEMKAKRVFWNAYNSVPAYKDFVDSNCNGIPQRFDEIPIMSKSNYIREYPLEKTLKYGKVPSHGFMDPSSGTSGRRTLWIRGDQEIANAKKVMELIRKMLLGNEDYIFINMFLPSAWNMGLMRGLGPLLMEEAWETMRDLGKDKKYLIMGHTSFMKYLVHFCPLDLNEYNVSFLIGGEHMSRALYHYFKEHGIKKIYSGYGASDIHFTVGMQGEFERALQQVCLENEALKKELIGENKALPYFFQYSPLNDYIEEKDGYLIFTDLDHTRVSPRVRYNLGDKGTIVRMSHVQKILVKYNISLNIKPLNNLPLVCLYGRAEDTITFNNADIGFDDLELAIYKTPELTNKWNRYAYNQYDGKLEFWIELAEGISPDEFNSAQLNEKIIARMSEINTQFGEAIQQVKKEEKPKLKIWELGKSPMKKLEVYRKAKYVYNVPIE